MRNEKNADGIYRMEYGIREEYGICKDGVKGRKCGSAQAASPFHPVSSTRYSHRFFQVKLFPDPCMCALWIEGLSVDLSPERRFEPRRAFRRSQTRIKSKEKLFR